MGWVYIPPISTPSPPQPVSPCQASGAARLLFKSPEAGATTVLTAAVAPRVPHPSWLGLTLGLALTLTLALTPTLTLTLTPTPAPTPTLTLTLTRGERARWQRGWRRGPYFVNCRPGGFASAQSRDLLLARKMQLGMDPLLTLP